MAKTKIVKFMCSIVLAVSLVLSQSYTAMASGSSTITEQQLGVLFDGMESICGCGGGGGIDRRGYK